VRESQAALSEADGSQFVPAVVDTPPSTSSTRRQCKVRRDEAEVGAGTIEIEIDGVTVRIGRDASAITIAAVLRALRAGA